MMLYEAGFDKVVFVIRKDLEEEFHVELSETVSRKTIKVEYAFQEVDDIPAGYTESLPEERNLGEPVRPFYAVKGS